MLQLGELRQTRVYQEGYLAGKLETLPRLVKLGLTVMQIAEALELEIETVERAIASLPAGQ